MQRTITQPRNVARTCATGSWRRRSLRRTQLGHTNAAFTLSVYAEAMDARDGELERIKALVNGAEWAPRGTSATSGGQEEPRSTWSTVLARIQSAMHRAMLASEATWRCHPRSRAET